MDKTDRRELRLQWIAILLTFAGLLATFYYQHQTLRSIRLESEVNSYLSLSERYHSLIYSLIRDDSEVFQKDTNELLGQHKYTIYETIDLFSTIYAIEKYHSELEQDIKPLWQARMKHFFKKPAVTFAWNSQKEYSSTIYDEEFISFVDTLCITP